MDASQNIQPLRRLWLGALTLLCCLGSSLSAAPWVSLTSYTEARRMMVNNDSLYVTTAGGLLVVTDPAVAGTQYTNLDGLGTNDLTDIIVAADGQKWVTGFGWLIRFDGVASVRYPIVDADGQVYRLRCVVDDGDFLWTGSDHGLILFSKLIDGGQIQDSYTTYGNLPSAPDIFDIALDGDSIWLATGAGLAVANRSDPNQLKVPSSWTTYSRADYPELNSDTIRSVARFDGQLWIGTEKGLYRLDEGTDSLVRESFAANSIVWSLAASGDSLFVYTRAGLGVISGGVVSSLPTPGLSGGVRTGATVGDYRWVASDAVGLYYGDESDLAPYLHTGLPENAVVDLTVTAGGVLTVLFQKLGPFRWQEDAWLEQPVSSVGDRAMSMVVDDQGRNYFGTYGRGLWRMGDSALQFLTGNSTLQEATPIGSDYVVCFDVALGDGYVFGANFEPRDGTRVAIAALDQIESPAGWTSLGVADGITGEQTVSVAQYGQTVAIGSGVSGVFWYDYGPDPFDKSDDSLVHFYSGNANPGLHPVSDVVRVVEFSPDGELWIGANYGVSRYDAGIEQLVDIDLPAGFGPDITSFAFEGRGNVWIGSRNGLIRLDAFTGERTLYTAANSGLVNDFVQNLTLSSATGDLYVSTPGGISIIPSTLGHPTENLDSVYAFPNPFYVGSSGRLLNFNYPLKAGLRVFTIAGELVIDLPVPVWDGRNADGREVASGVYLWVLVGEAGEVGRGKLLLIRQ